MILDNWHVLLLVSESLCPAGTAALEICDLVTIDVVTVYGHKNEYFGGSL